MITIPDILSARQVALEITATTQESAIHEVAQRLRGDERVRDWNAFVNALRTGSSCIANERGDGICIPHARTNHVSSMVMAAGRVSRGIWFEEPGTLVHYIFVIGVPTALASDYLRIVGALARTFRSLKSEAALRHAKAAQEFIDVLSASEMPV
jgi:mannitol/fructose-specific phosphotransferase system IIA component (Ntr-type)